MIFITEAKVKSIIYSDKTKSYTYGLVRDDNSLFYVGVGIKNRVLQHKMSFELKNNNRLKSNTIKKQNNLRYVIFIVHKDRSVCLQLEKSLIEKFGRKDNNTGILCNLTDGGEIGPTGMKISDETRIKLKKLRQESAQHLSIKNKEYWDTLSDEEKVDKVKTMRNGITKNTHLKIGVKSKERWENEDYKNRLSLKQKESQSKVADVHSSNMKLKWKDPVFREQMLLARKLAKGKRIVSKQDTTEIK